MNCELNGKIILLCYDSYIKNKKGCRKMQQRKYMNISRLKTKDLPGFRVGDYIVVQEKIDGANFSIRYSPDGRSIFIICCFRNVFRGVQYK